MEWEGYLLTAEKQVLLLNSTEEVIQIISWKKAVKLLTSGKAAPPFNYKQKYKVRMVNGSYNLPAAIVLVKYVYLPEETKNLLPTRHNIFRRDKYTCQYCGKRCKTKKNRTLDHVHPRSKGGDSGWTNIVTCCFACNQKKGSKLLKEIPDMELIARPRRPKAYALEIEEMTEQGRKLWGRWLFYT